MYSTKVSDPQRALMRFPVDASRTDEWHPLLSLALCELHIALAALALRVLPRMQLFETTQDDVLYDHDMFIPMPKPSSTGVRITIGS